MCEEDITVHFRDTIQWKFELPYNSDDSSLRANTPMINSMSAMSKPKLSKESGPEMNLQLETILNQSDNQSP